MQNKAINELLVKYPPLEATFIGIAHGVIRTAPWGLLWRVGIGSFLSIIDVGTDITVMVGFWREGLEGYFNTMASSIVASMALQVSSVVVRSVMRALIPCSNHHEYLLLHESDRSPPKKDDDHVDAIQGDKRAEDPH